MGSQTFFHERFATGKTAEECFKDAQEEARYDHGHSGYTGTVAEKRKFVMMPSVEGKETAWDMAMHYINECDPRVDEKWGPAGCVMGKNSDGYEVYCFFGWASC